MNGFGLAANLAYLLSIHIQLTINLSKMKKWISIAAALLILTSASLGPITVLPIGSALPESGRKMKDIGGKEIAMADAAGENGFAGDVLVQYRRM